MKLMISNNKPRPDEFGFHWLKGVFIFLVLLLSGCTNNKLVHNPVLPGFNPDPSVCRVGDDYYLVTSSFEYFPGVPVYHSKDLVNWKLIGHVIDRSEQMDFSNVSSTAGIYAPTIRYNNGTFYMITTLVGGTRKEDVPHSGNFIMTATNPAGPWSEPHWIEDAPGIDPSLFFDDDGKAYYCGNHSAEIQDYTAQRDIWIQQIDLETFKLIGPKGFLESKPYFVRDIIGSAVAFEAPHLYKKDGVYYLMLAHGGTGTGHAESIWKSNNPLGSWEMNPLNPILTNRGYSSSGINCTGHADLFQTAEGNWYAVFLAVRSNDGKRNIMGRETFLEPVDWSGVWPVVNPGENPGRAEILFPAPEIFKGKQRSFDFFDDFNSNELGLDWTFIRNPKEKWWSLNTIPGYLEMKLRPDKIDNFAQPGFLGIRVIDMKVECEASVDFKPTKESECAGIALLRGHKPNWSLVKEKSGDQLKASVYYTDSLVGQIDLHSDSEIEMKIRIDDFWLQFFVKEQKSQWQMVSEVDGAELGFPPAGRFTGSFVGLYSSARGDTVNARAYFNWYKMKRL